MVNRNKLSKAQLIEITGINQSRKANLMLLDEIFPLGWTRQATIASLKKRIIQYQIISQK